MTSQSSYNLYPHPPPFDLFRLMLRSSQIAMSPSPFRCVALKDLISNWFETLSSLQFHPCVPGEVVEELKLSWEEGVITANLKGFAIWSVITSKASQCKLLLYLGRHCVPLRCCGRYFLELKTNLICVYFDCFSTADMPFLCSSYLTHICGGPPSNIFEDHYFL